VSEDKVFITLIDDNGDELDFELVISLEIDGNEYKILVLEDEIDLDEPEALIVRVGYDEIGEEFYEDIEDEDEFKRVKEALDELEFNEDDELN
jgi:uncharacterized protein YrzB (UPF0473 family)